MQISNEVLSVLSTLEIEANAVKMCKLERGLYLKVNQVLEACGGKWNRKQQAHVFDSDARERIEVVLATGEITTAREVGFFRTPQPLARRLVEMADVRPGHLVLEPSAGDGTIVQELLRVEAAVWALERDDRRREQLIAKTSAAQTVAIVIAPTVGYDDFMAYDPIEPCDRVVMNPPFRKVGLGDHLDHVRHAFSMLVPGGVLVSVLPQGVLFRQDKRHREFREWVIDAGALPPAGEYVGLTELPDDSFKESGTSVRTCVLRMVKP